MAQLVNFPLLNIFWGVLIIGTILLSIGKERLVTGFNVPQILVPIFSGCMMLIIFILPILLAFTVIHGIGELVARKDEADIMLVFDEKDLKNGSPILIYKKKLKKKGVTIREFYSRIPMEKWQEKKEALADVLNVHFIGEIEYGGKSNGNIILFKTAKGRKPIDRGDLYDETFM